MSMEFRSPSLSAQTPQGQINQLQSFLRQHVQQLNWVLKDLETQGGLTDQQLEAAAEAAGRSAEVFRTIYRRIRRKQAQENFVGAAKRTVLEGGSWAQGDSAAADMEAVERYTVFVAVTGGEPVICGRQGSVIRGQGLKLTCGREAVMVTQAESPLTALYAVV